jgi:antitoxin (DNA-binding transcriptional repressor) of toxin-antitoxin stability system
MTTAPAPSGDRVLALAVREAQVRFSQLVGLAELTDQVTVVHRDGRPVAAVVPAGAARSLAEARRSEVRAQASAAGWSRRLTDLRDQLTRRHAAERAALLRALAEAWDLLDRHSPPGADREVDRLRAAHRDLRDTDATRAA